MTVFFCRILQKLTWMKNEWVFWSWMLLFAAISRSGDDGVYRTPPVCSLLWSGVIAQDVDPTHTGLPLPQHYTEMHVLYIIWCSVKAPTVMAAGWPTAREKKKKVSSGISRCGKTNSTWKFIHFCQPVSFLAELERKLLNELLAWIEKGYLKNSF